MNNEPLCQHHSSAWRKNPRTRLALSIAALLLMAFNAAIAEPHSGKLTRKVFTLPPSGDRVYLSGTTVSLECPTEPLNNASMQTDDTGTFRFAALANADCAVTASATGFQPFTGSAQVQEAHE